MLSLFTIQDINLKKNPALCFAPSQNYTSDIAWFIWHYLSTLGFLGTWTHVAVFLSLEDLGWRNTLEIAIHSCNAQLHTNIYGNVQHEWTNGWDWLWSPRKQFLSHQAIIKYHHICILCWCSGGGWDHSNSVDLFRCTQYYIPQTENQDGSHI